MPDSQPPLDPAIATQLVRRAIDERLTVTGVRQMRGGMSNPVCELLTDGDPPSVVVKLAGPDQLQALQRERASLDWYRTHTQLPVPRVYNVVLPMEHFRAAALVMQRMPGCNLRQSRLSDKGRRYFQHELAHHVAVLHAHRRDDFGSVLVGEPRYARWADMFRPIFQREFNAVGSLLQPRNRAAVAELIDDFDLVFPHDERAPATLVHGDLWATNILVDDSHADRPRITAFVDCGAHFADAEYELAYLRLFHTANETFFQAYHRLVPSRSGWERRMRVYWLCTRLQHLRKFDDRHRTACDDLVRQIRDIQW